jgi:hypothetical protein
VDKKDRMDFYDVCDARRLAEAVVSKCTVKDDIVFYDGIRDAPWFPSCTHNIILI